MDDNELEKYRKFYSVHLETDYFAEIRKKFKENKELDAFDFFCIVIWKANRAKTKVANGLIKKTGLPLNEAVKKITSDLAKAKENKDKMKILLIDGIGIPMASAILAVLEPNNFTVYDYRASEHKELEKFKNITGKTDKAIQKYLEYTKKVQNIAPNRILKEIDEYLWGKSFHEQLANDIKKEFKTNN